MENIWTVPFVGVAKTEEYIIDIGHSGIYAALQPAFVLVVLVNAFVPIVQ